MSDGFGHEKPGEGFTNDWLTPPKLLAKLGEFDLDPCASPVASVWETWTDEKNKKQCIIHPFLTIPEAHAFHYTRDSHPHKHDTYVRPWPTAKTMIALPDDGLAVEWQGRAFVNCPYGPHVEAWAKKLAEHGNGIFLIFNRSETDTWRFIFSVGDAYLFPHGRTCFYLPDGKRAKSGTAPSALIAFGEQNVECLRTCGLAGAFFRRAEITGGIKISSL